MEFLSLQEGLLCCSVESLHFTICLGMKGTGDVMSNIGQLIEFLTGLKNKLQFLGVYEIKFIKKILGHIHEITFIKKILAQTLYDTCINSECTGMYTYLIDRLPSLVRYMNLGSSITADKLIHELGHTFSTFPYQGLRLNEFTRVVYAGDDGVVPLWSLRQVGDEIDAKLSPGFKRYMYRFQLISTFFKFGTSLHMLACFTAVNKLIHLVLWSGSKLWMTIGRLFYLFQSGHSLP